MEIPTSGPMTGAGAVSSPPSDLEPEGRSLEETREAVVALVAKWGYERREEPFELSSGFRSRDYIDGKRAISSSSRLRLVGRAVLDVAREMQIEFDAVGGLTMGADPLALAVALAADDEKAWFSVRKEAKRHGKQKLVEGAELGPESRVLLVDDVVTSGRSIIKALDAIKRDTAASIVLGVALVDRGEGAAKRLAERNVPYMPIITYRDLGIDPVPS